MVEAVKVSWPTIPFGGTGEDGLTVGGRLPGSFGQGRGETILFHPFDRGSEPLKGDAHILPPTHETMPDG